MKLNIKCDFLAFFFVLFRIKMKCDRNLCGQIPNKNHCRMASVRILLSRMLFFESCLFYLIKSPIMMSRGNNKRGENLINIHFYISAMS